MTFHVYILANYSDGPMYVGHTDDIGRRAWERREEIYPGFTKHYRIKRLVWMEAHEARDSAFQRERAIKRWRREEQSGAPDEPRLGRSVRYLERWAGVGGGRSRTSRLCRLSGMSGIRVTA
jgi:putative endonuclease